MTETVSKEGVEVTLKMEEDILTMIFNDGESIDEIEIEITEGYSQAEALFEAWKKDT